MGKKSKSKGKFPGAPSVQSRKRGDDGGPSGGVEDVKRLQCNINKDDISNSLDSLMQCPSEDDVIASIRELYKQVLRKKIVSKTRICLLEQKEKEMLDECSQYEKRIEEEGAMKIRATSQKNKLQVLLDKLNEKKELLLTDIDAKVEADKESKKKRTNELMKQTQDISAKLEQFNLLRVEYSEENAALKEKLRAVLDQYSSQEEEFNRKVEEKNAKIVEASAMVATETNSIEKGASEVGISEKSFEEAFRAEKLLQEELRDKAKQFEEFQVKLNKSNDCFGDFKRRMEEKTKAIAMLEKENKHLAEKKLKTEQAIKDMTAQMDSQTKASVDALDRQGEKLSQLCAVLKSQIRELKEELQQSATDIN